MNGRQLIDKICDLLNKENVRLYDSQIVRRLSELSKHELDQLIKETK